MIAIAPKAQIINLRLNGDTYKACRRGGWHEHILGPSLLCSKEVSKLLDSEEEYIRLIVSNHPRKGFKRAILTDDDAPATDAALNLVGEPCDGHLWVDGLGWLDSYWDNIHFLLIQCEVIPDSEALETALFADGHTVIGWELWWKLEIPTDEELDNAS